MLRSGSTALAEANTLLLVPSPVAWTPNGVLVQQILYATDALPRDPTLLDPADPTGQHDRRVHDGAIIGVYPSPDGTRFAIVTGELPLGGGQPTAQIREFDAGGVQLASIRDEQPGLLRALDWSPDYSTPNVTLHLVGADGTNAQELDLAAQGVGGSFRDVAWCDNATLLLLTENAQVQLDALPSNDFTAAALQSLRAFPGQQSGAGNGRILYVPR